jgi:predicted RNA-binding protein YlxR (DUF448 family)
VRTCAACRRKAEKESFIRIVEEDGKPVFDMFGRLPGRGFNVCPSKRCLNNFLKRRYGERVDREAFIRRVADALIDYISHLISIAVKANLAVIGQDRVKGLGNRRGTLLVSDNISPKTVESLSKPAFTILRLPSDKLHGFGIVFVEGVGIGRKIANVAEKIKGIAT